MGHTPGPWFRESDVNCDGSDWILVTNDYQEIADLRLENDGLCVPENEQDANARLIAASPDLLAALKQCLPIVDAYRRASGGDGDVSAAYARSVIATAEGTDVEAGPMD